MKKILLTKKWAVNPWKTRQKPTCGRRALQVLSWDAVISKAFVPCCRVSLQALVIFLSEATVHAGSLSWCAPPGSSPNPEIGCFPEGTRRGSSSLFSRARAGGIFLQPPSGFWGSLYAVQALCPKANGPVGQEEKGKYSGRLSRRSEVFQLHTWASFRRSGTPCWNRDLQKILVGSRCVWVLGKKVLAMHVI